jgi:hypothetical protein
MRISSSEGVDGGRGWANEDGFEGNIDVRVRHSKNGPH